MLSVTMNIESIDLGISLAPLVKTRGFGMTPLIRVPEYNPAST
jgi:hypothetical protein